MMRSIGSHAAGGGDDRLPDRWASEPIGARGEIALRDGLRIGCQGACKPGSVLAAGFVSDPCRGGSHSSRRCVATPLVQPTRILWGEAPCQAALAIGSTRDPYSALLRVGFAKRAPLPEPRCALTAPFHPCCRLYPVSGILSVALSLRLPAAGVTRHPCFVEPGLSSNAPLAKARPRLPGPLAAPT